jgi:hypothetical protein
MSNFQRTGKNVLRNRVGVMLARLFERAEWRIVAKHSIGEAGDKLKNVNHESSSMNREEQVLTIHD